MLSGILSAYVVQKNLKAYRVTSIEMRRSDPITIEQLNRQWPTGGKRSDASATKITLVAYYNTNRLTGQLHPPLILPVGHI